MLFCISKVLQNKFLDKVRNSKFCGIIMIDKSTDVSVISHIVIFTCFIEDEVPVSVFLSLIQIEDEKKILKRFIRLC